jgi:hypothetical protein
MLAGLSSCDYYNTSYYIINNDLDSAVVFHYRIHDAFYHDSTLLIPRKGFDTIYEFGRIGGKYVSDQRYDDAIDNIGFKVNDTLISLDESLWLNGRITNSTDNYIITIDSSMLP